MRRSVAKTKEGRPSALVCAKATRVLPTCRARYRSAFRDAAGWAEGYLTLNGPIANEMSIPLRPVVRSAGTHIT
jgi:hypothetical protein